MTEKPIVFFVIWGAIFVLIDSIYLGIIFIPNHTKATYDKLGFFEGFIDCFRMYLSTSIGLTLTLLWIGPICFSLIIFLFADKKNESQL